MAFKSEKLYNIEALRALKPPVIDAVSVDATGHIMETLHGEYVDANDVARLTANHAVDRETGEQVDGASAVNIRRVIGKQASDGVFTFKFNLDSKRGVRPVRVALWSAVVNAIEAAQNKTREAKAKEAKALSLAKIRDAETAKAEIGRMSEADRALLLKALMGN